MHWARALLSPKSYSGVLWETAEKARDGIHKTGVEAGKTLGAFTSVVLWKVL